MAFRRKHSPNINTLACSKAETYSPCLKKYEPLLPCAESLNRDKIKTNCLLMSDVQYY